ncbi:MAG: alternative ribosome rescue aminoacyl-tRNA hydrolase ArfB [Opitutales bacterium]
MLRISNQVTIPDEELEIQAVRAQGPGGQHVNKSNTAVQLRFNIAASSLPAFYKTRLFQQGDPHLTETGDLLIQAQEYRSQERNRQAALERLAGIIRRAGQPVRKRRATQPTRTAQKRRTDAKKHRGRIKALRRKPPEG